MNLLDNWQIAGGNRTNNSELMIYDYDSEFGGLPSLTSLSAGVRYRNPITKNFYNKVFNPVDRWQISENDKIGKALTKKFLKRAMMKPFAFYNGMTMEDPVSKYNDQIWETLRAMGFEDWLRRAGQRQMVHGWQITKPEIEQNEEGEILSIDFSNVIGEHEIWESRGLFFDRYNISDVINRDRAIANGSELPKIKLNQIKDIRVNKKPILPLFRNSEHLYRTYETWPMSECFHTTQGGYHEGLGDSTFAAVFDSIVKLAEQSDNNHFRQGIWAQALVGDDWKPDQIRKFVQNALYALNNKQLFVSKVILDDEGKPTSLPLLQFSNTVQDGNPSKSSSGGGGLISELSSEWASLCLDTGYSIRFFTGHPGGALAAASEDTLADVKNDIANFSTISKELIIPFLKLLQQYGILEAPPVEGSEEGLNFDKVIIKSWWEIELDKIQLQQVGEDAAQNTEKEGETKKEDKKEDKKNEGTLANPVIINLPLKDHKEDPSKIKHGHQIVLDHEEDKKHEKELPTDKKLNHIEIFKQLHESRLNEVINEISKFMVLNGAIGIEEVDKEYFERFNKVEYMEGDYEETETKDIRIEHLHVNKDFDLADPKLISLEELFEKDDDPHKTLKALEPIVINEEYEILDGNHRVFLFKKKMMDYLKIKCIIKKRKEKLNYSMPFTPMSSSTVRGAAVDDKNLYVQFHSQSGGGYKYQFSDDTAAMKGYQELAASTSKGGYVWSNLKGGKTGPAWGTGKPTPGGTTSSIVPYDKVGRLPNLGYFGRGATEGHKGFRAEAEELRELKMKGIAQTAQEAGESTTILGEKHEWTPDHPDLKTEPLGNKRAYYPHEMGKPDKTKSDFYSEKNLYGAVKPKLKTPTIYPGTPKRTGKAGAPKKGKTGFQQMKEQHSQGQQEIKDVTAKKELDKGLQVAQKEFERKKGIEDTFEKNQPKKKEGLGTKVEPLAEGFKPKMEQFSDESRTKATDELKSIFAKRKKNSSEYFEIEKWFQRVIESEEAHYGRQLGLEIKEIKNSYPELLRDSIETYLDNPNNASKVVKHSKTTIYNKFVNNEGNFQRYNRFTPTLEKEDDEYWYAIVNGMSKTNPFHYLERGQIVTEYQCEEDIRNNVGADVPLGIYHDLEKGSINLPDWQVVGRFNVLMYDEENGVEVTKIKTNKRLVKEYFDNMGEHDWITESYEAGVVPDVSTSYNTDVKVKTLNDGTKVRLQTNFVLKSVSYVPRGNCSGDYCTGEIVRMNSSVIEQIKTELEKIVKKIGVKKYSFDDLLNLAVKEVKKKK